ncbi:crosslink repair DNA glycosylase YcaQ family protein [Oceanispirochaeta sp.]|uniref:winged helix-turn-helix domain-containing protein n=1 Tax=Oceanispirochaeta sp. TaxID=2035350 RepID=UPI002627321D|nr:crosslink repair DNA glycosylase YcaQ family protein [Oceanispirochaeta sp.]MDA3956001.1 winged helix DNA-binding domain-containing protein [Oceanispirochaeta sp.]
MSAIQLKQLAELIMEKDQATAYLLQYHGLHNPQSLEGKESILPYIKKVGCIQFDPLNVCGMNPDLVLQSRISDYKQSWLQELLYQDRVLCDGWDKMMSIFPSDDWPFFTRLRLEMTSSYLTRYDEVKNHLPRFLREVRDNGPLSSLEFADKGKVNWAWGSSRLAKAALEGLFFSGVLSIHHRKNSNRVYDLTERLLPSELISRGDPYKDLESYRKNHILRRIKSAGIAGFSNRDFWFGIAETNMKEIRSTMTALMDEGIITKIILEGSKRDWYAPTEDLQNFLTNPEPIKTESPAVLLAALDNIMWNRELLEELFFFNYRWEVYTPAVKRQYGYYVLPILYQGKIIGRCEPAIDRKSKTLVLKGIWFEKDTIVNEEMIEALRKMLSRFCQFMGVPKMVTAPGMSRDYRSRFTGITASE